MNEGKIKESDLVAHRHRLEVMRLVYSGEAEGEDVWGDLGAEEGLRPAPGRYQRSSQRTTLPPYMSVAISTSSSAAYILALLETYEHLLWFDWMTL